MSSQEDEREEWSEKHLLRRILEQLETQTALLTKIDADLNRPVVVPIPKTLRVKVG